MRLKSIELRNFKGIRDLVFEPDGRDAAVYGQNATGKTTLADSFSWLLFGKDSLNRADFEIKPIAPDGEPEHGLEHEVSATLDVDGEELILRKVLKEKWTKPRGAPTAVFSGHTIDHFIDSVPVKEREYKDRIAEIAPEETFRLLTNPRYFSESMKWQDRRRILLSVCGDITDQDVIASDLRLSSLPDILGKHTLDDYRKILAGKRAEINKQLTEIPIRISELQRGLTANDVDPVKLKMEIADLETSRAGLGEQLATLTSGGAIAEKTRELRDIESKLIALQNKESRQLNEALEVKRQALKKMKFGLGAVEADIRTLSRKIVDTCAEIGGNLRRMDMLRSEWIGLDASQFEGDHRCPTCGQELPEDKVQEARDNFNQNKATRLGEISAEGKRLKDLCTTLETRNATHQGMVVDKQAGMEKLAAEISALEAEIKTPAVTGESRERDELLQQQHNLTEEISAVTENRQGAIDEIKEQIEQAEHEIAEHNRILAQIEQNKTSLSRIHELKLQDRDLAGSLEKLESDLFLTEQFIRSKVTMLEEKINSRFQLARFKMFDQQINGALSECCEITVAGVPYWSVNNASRINAGIDVANVLSEFYGLTAPCFIDNAEAVNEILPSKNQQIKLVVSHDKTLRIEIEKENTNERRSESIAA